MPIDTPVLLIIFRRPDTTRRVFEAIRQARPKQLFIAADGPRSDIQGEEKKCRMARDVVADIDWECEVYRDYADENMGCGVRPATGITWAFEHVDRAIILEDDCLPHPNFFSYCEELLEKYEDDERVMHINGNNYGANFNQWFDYSYSFSNYPQVWGWATWRRAWKYFDFEILDWPEFKKMGLLSSLDGGEQACKYRKNKWNQVYRGGDLNIWDYQWHFAVQSQGGLSVAPAHNLIKNIGFNELATHTTNKDSDKANLEHATIKLPLEHPPFVVSDRRVNQVYRRNMHRPSLLNRIVKRVRRALLFG